MSELRQRSAAKAKAPAVAPISSDGKRKAPAAATFSSWTPTWVADGEWIYPFLVLLVCAFTRYWRLAEPNGVVFDETHFGRFTNQYFAGAYLFDIHPPLGKLVFVAVCKLVGYEWTKCGFANISDEFGPECKFLWIRGTAAFFGTLTAPIFYAIARNWGGSKLAGVIAAAAFIFDGLNTTEDRLILTDSQLIFWIAASLLAAQRWWRMYNEHDIAVGLFTKRDPKGRYPTSREMALANSRGGMDGHMFHFGWSILKWTTLMGLVCANAVSVKWTALATPGMIGLESLFGLFFLRRAIPFHHLLAVAAVVFATYSTYFYIHFSLLPNTGDGDAFMKIDFQRMLVNNSNYDPIAVGPGFWKNFYYLNGEMLSANARIAIRHGWESKWYEWPLNLRGLLYYSKDVADGMTESVYLIGNPLVLWPMLGFIMLTAVLVLFYIRYKREPGLELATHYSSYFAVVAFCVITYSLNLLPYIAVNRSAFCYHYMPALMYAELLSALTMDRLFGPRYMPLASQVMLLVMVSGFVYFMPWIYALPLSAEGHARRRWLKRWD